MSHIFFPVCKDGFMYINGITKRQVKRLYNLKFKGHSLQDERSRHANRYNRFPVEKKKLEDQLLHRAEEVLS